MPENDNSNWHVRFSGLALEQLTEIIRYLTSNGETEYAAELLKRIRQEGRDKLKTLPHRGRLVPELSEVTRRYREIRLHSYRLVYKTLPESHTVIILIVAHVRQDIQQLLISQIME